jgi:hypothetical protein
VNTWALTLPACLLWWFGWYDGWNNSFNKGYEQAAVGPLISLLGIAWFITAMFYVPLAQARQAVTGEWRSFYQFRLIWKIVRDRWVYCVLLAVLYALLSVPLSVLKTSPMFWMHSSPSLGALTSAQVEQFQRDGYLLVEDMFDPVADIDPIIEEYEGVLDALADKLYAQGEISSTHAELPFGQRLIEIYKESGAVHAQYFDFSLPQADVREDTPFWAGPAVFAINNDIDQKQKEAALGTTAAHKGLAKATRDTSVSSASRFSCTGTSGRSVSAAASHHRASVASSPARNVPLTTAHR